jgi:hypothetical protein
VINNVKPYVLVLLLVVGVLGGFYGGYRFGHTTVSAATTGSSQGTRTGGGGFGGGRTGGGGGGFGAACPSPGAPSPSPGTNAVAAGTITDLTNSSLTITEANCEIKVTYGNTVQVSKNVAGSTSDLQDNLTVTVIGTRQADGSVKATTIQIGNGFGGGRGFGNPAGAQASPSPG